MIVNHCKRVSKIRHLILFRFNEIYSSMRMSETGVQVTGEKVKKKKKKQEDKKNGKDVNESCNKIPQKGMSSEIEAKAVDVASTMMQDKKTVIKKKAYDKEVEKFKKEKDLVMNDFLIQNIMTFPLHATSCDTEIEDEIEFKMKKFPSVTSILQETMAADTRKRLELWKEKMIEMMGAEKFISHQNDPVEILKKKRLQLKRKKSKKIVVATLNRGTRLHSALKSYLLGKDVEKIPIHEEVEGCWKSVQTVLPQISDVKVVESDIFHPHLQYKGIVDCVANYKNTPHVIEWKQSEKVKKDLSSTFDAPIQLTAYMGALSWCKGVNLPTPVTCGLVVIAYTNGAPADVFEMDLDFCQSYWEQWLRRLQQYWSIRSSNSQVPV